MGIQMWYTPQWIPSLILAGVTGLAAPKGILDKWLNIIIFHLICHHWSVVMLKTASWSFEFICYFLRFPVMNWKMKNLVCVARFIIIHWSQQMHVNLSQSVQGAMILVNQWTFKKIGRIKYVNNAIWVAFYQIRSCWWHCSLCVWWDEHPLL